MSTYLLVHAALLGLVFYGLGAAFGMPLLGAAAGLVFTIGWVVIRSRGRPSPFLGSAIVGLGAVTLGHALGQPVLIAKANAVLMAALSVGARSACGSAGHGPRSFQHRPMAARRRRLCS